MTSMEPRRPRYWLLIVVQASAACFAAGMFLPLFTVIPRLDEWTGLARILAPDQMKAHSVTLVGGIASMWQAGEGGLAVLLAFFSICLPLVKLSLLSAEAAAPGCLWRSWHRIMKFASRYAMLEVFVVALLVILAKGLPGGSSIVLGPGTAAFATSVILGLAAGMIEKKSASPPPL